jgi:hypothetical protein
MCLIVVLGLTSASIYTNQITYRYVTRRRPDSSGFDFSSGPRRTLLIGRSLLRVPPRRDPRRKTLVTGPPLVVPRLKREVLLVHSNPKYCNYVF